MKKIGLIGESPHDTKAIENLLNQKFSKDLIFVEMIKNIRGSNLDNQKAKRRLRINYETEKPDFLIFIRDLDALEDDKKKLIERKNYFSSFNSVVDKKGFYLLNIYEIEALILADIDNFNKYFNANIVFKNNPMKQIEPKEFLMKNSNYKESDCKELFKYLNITTIINNCVYFRKFINNFSAVV